jgi:Flp pilus assembly protein TadG
MDVSRSTCNTRRNAATSRKSSNSRRQRQGGGALLEGALIFLPMMAMFFGIVDVSFAVFIQSTLNTAAREGVRFAVTFSPNYNGTSCASSQATCIAQVVQDNATGFLSGTTNSSYIKVNYYTANDLTNPVDSCNSSGTCTVNPAGAATATLPQTLSNGRVVTFANQPGNIVEVSITGYPWNWLVPIRGYGLGTGGITMSADSTDILNALAVGVTTPPTP